MSNEKELSTLEQMTKESFVNRPNQATEAIEEYILNLKEESPQKASSLQDKLNASEKYLEQFKVAITQTSLMIFLISLEASNSSIQEKNEVQEFLAEVKIDLNKYIREFMLYAQKDDKDIYEMRLFYLDGLTGSELGLNLVDAESYNSDEEVKKATKVANDRMQKYDTILNNFKKSYMDTKLHLQ